MNFIGFVGAFWARSSKDSIRTLAWFNDVIFAAANNHNYETAAYIAKPQGSVCRKCTTSDPGSLSVASPATHPTRMIPKSQGEFYNQTTSRKWSMCFGVSLFFFASNFFGALSFLGFLTEAPVYMDSRPFVWNYCISQLRNHKAWMILKELKGWPKKVDSWYPIFFVSLKMPNFGRQDMEGQPACKECPQGTNTFGQGSSPGGNGCV